MLHCHLSHSNNAMLWMADSYKKREVFTASQGERERERASKGMSQTQSREKLRRQRKRKVWEGGGEK